jgi:hypothetical protein
MPKYRYLALAAACAVVLAPGGVAFAASAHQAAKKPVLTTGKVGGSAVKKGAKITAGLAKGSKLVVSLGAAGTVSCTTSAITAKVTANPTSKGAATLSLTGQSIAASSCTLKTSFPVSLTSVAAYHLPANVTVKPAKGGGSVTVAASKASKPFGLKAVINASGVGAGTLTCIFATKSLTAKASNSTNSIEVSKETLKLQKGSSGDCSDVGKSVTVSVTYGPLETSGKKVFVS